MKKRIYMDLPTGLLIYTTLALGLSLTTYLTIYRSAIKLLEEILDTEDTVYSGLSGFMLWIVFAAIMAPWTLTLMLKNNNTETSEEMAATLAQKILDIDDEE